MDVDLAELHGFITDKVQLYQGRVEYWNTTQEYNDDCRRRRVKNNRERGDRWQSRLAALDAVIARAQLYNEAWLAGQPKEKDSD